MNEQELKDILARALGEIADELWSKEEAARFVDRFAQQIAEQKILAATAPPDKQREHADNLRTLLAHAQTEATRRYLRLHSQGLRAFTAAVKAVISLIIIAAFSAT